MFSLNRERDSEAYRVSGSALEEDLSLLRRRMIQAGKCYCLLILATLAWLAFAHTLDHHPNILQSVSFTKFNLDVPSFPVQDLFAHFKPIDDSIPPLNVRPYQDGLAGSTLNKPVERITLSRIVGRKFRLNDRKALRTTH
ncbi:hypothetical protein PGT21_036083 [Puccinia graminis f. sp. tritici]|uniref:Uncharacterized protein n=1 Tax=Puccinia graminis f. sp. tritici TaxID=56615 RepID=A0A5B0PAC5_PUCGR|nr:hypothetical protein PGTUg99_018889 [Puccinia graminis f. sp. tritici]KAA1098555.1 hypothetical protein PGT21_036418 [Puccinia graminis f. sp. tritici]KAA1100398.1 hypothetical protein PGTUg99_025484 [Puccinia graminis f. sp. tritici]KAA1102116.1 hypothetical protein PGT21_036083 [Puccinia graminis f. sp. tritici]